MSKDAPHARLIATHTKAANHWILSRAELKVFAEREGLASNWISGRWRLGGAAIALEI